MGSVERDGSGELGGERMESRHLLAFLEQAGSGCVSGRVSEWPQFKPACRWAADEIARLTRCRGCGVLGVDRNYNSCPRCGASYPPPFDRTCHDAPKPHAATTEGSQTDAE
jgi:hypothetical protein